MGGTWDLFRYPGVRSDSDMHTLGYSFRPWVAAKAIVDAPSILNYLRDTAREYGITQKIRFGQRVIARRLVDAGCALDGSAARRRRHNLVHPLQLPLHVQRLLRLRRRLSAATFQGRHGFAVRVVHPQHWPEDLAYAGKQVLVIGSGATAVTLVPAMAEQAAHVTMLQRSPTWMVARPSLDPLGARLRSVLPLTAALWLTRWKNILFGLFVVRMCRRRPQRMRELLLGGVRHALGPQADIAKDYTPRYNPWEQRLCLVPDGDFFKAIRSGRASVVTDQIESFTETGVTLASGATLPADIIVSATGLKLVMLGNAELFVDGQRIESARTVNYKGVMATGVPNLASTFGYTTASWTLKADLTARYVCRLLNHMRRTGARECRVPPAEPGMALLPWVDFSSGYFQRAADLLPRQGARKPWKLNQNYLSDVLALRFGSIDDGVLQFAR